MGYLLRQFLSGSGAGLFPTSEMKSVGRSEQSIKVMHYPTTPDGRYFVVKGRLWRVTVCPAGDGTPNRQGSRMKHNLHSLFGVTHAR